MMARLPPRRSFFWPKRFMGPMAAQSLNSEAATLYEYGRDRGSNVHLTALIALQRKLLDAASSDDERGIAHDNLGTALLSLGERESGTGRQDLKRRLPPIARRWRKERGIAFRSIGRGRR
jgi:hypothetical protein